MKVLLKYSLRPLKVLRGPEKRNLHHQEELQVIFHYFDFYINVFNKFLPFCPWPLIRILSHFPAAIEDTTIDVGDFFKGPLPGKFLKLLGYLALSRLGIYIPLGGVNREAFVGNLDQNSLLGTLDSFSGGGIGRLGIGSLGIVPFINAQIVFQLLTQIYPKLQELQKREGEAGRKKVLQYTRYASVGFAVVQVIIIHDFQIY